MEGTIFDDLKLRASYGTAGNQSIGNFEFLNLFGFGTYNGFTTGIPLGVGNPEIQWESQAIFDVGIEYGTLHEVFFSNIPCCTSRVEITIFVIRTKSR